MRRKLNRFRCAKKIAILRKRGFWWLTSHQPTPNATTSIKGVSSPSFATNRLRGKAYFGIYSKPGQRTCSPGHNSIK